MNSLNSAPWLRGSHKLWTAISCIVWILFFPAASTEAQKVSALISTDKTYVNAPVVLQLRIDNSKKYSLPEDFKIAGCEVKIAGPPSQSSQISITNGRRYERRSIAVQYFITPKNAGKFQIPRLTLTVDGKNINTKPITFEAEKSETGDLMLIEIQGKDSQVYVGQPLELTLKLWVRPFSAPENKIEFDANQMWQTISDTTTWGAFESRIQELRKQRARPSAQKVRRTNEAGQPRDYFVYELDATIYPTKPGKIDASDLQVVVNYPVEIGRSRDPFESMFGGSSLFGRLRNDDLFGSRSRLRVTKSRPISANANVDTTEVLPVPEAGKPDDYRGAVGQYLMIAQASPTTVDAGDPITLKLGITGDGPMNLIQAPPLSELTVLTRDFQVVDQSLAGYVQDNTKAFVTSIRPRNKSVQEIPALPFSFFNPETDSYQTVFTDPIPITVNASEQLSLDSIIGIGTAATLTNAIGTDNAVSFNNVASPSILTPTPTSPNFPWRFFAIGPPIFWLVVATSKLIFKTGIIPFRFRSPAKLAIKKINTAQTASQVHQALIQFVASVTHSPCTTQSLAAGSLRTLGLQPAANRIESVFAAIAQNQSPSFGAVSTTKAKHGLDEIRATACQLVEDLTPAVEKQLSYRVRRQQVKHSAATVVFFLAMLPGIDATATDNECEYALEISQLELLLNDANQSYQEGLASEADQAVAKIAFENAAAKYQLIVDAGVRNADLYLNLGNAHYQAGDVVLSIASYHRALKLAPLSKRGKALLDQATQRLNEQNANSTDPRTTWPDQILKTLTWPISRFGQWPIGLIFGVASIAFWGLIILRTVAGHQAIMKWAVLPAVVLLITGGALIALESSRNQVAIVVPAKIELRSADGAEFPVTASIDNARGRTVDVIQKRAGWIEIEFSDASRGWTSTKHLEILE